MLSRQLERYGQALVLIAVVMIAAVVSGFYILSQERLASPFASSYTVKAAFTSVTGVAPGLGEPVEVAGVQVGQIGAVTLDHGVGVLHMRIDPGKLKHVYSDARATLIPVSPLKDMQVDLAPGAPPAQPLASGAEIPVSHDVSPVDSDDLLAALDTDTRSWIVSLIAGLDQGTTGRAHDINTLLRDLDPTLGSLRRVGDALAARRAAIRRLVGNLAVLTSAAGQRDREIARVVSSGNTVLAALASQDGALRSSVAELPGTLTDLNSALIHTRSLADLIPPKLTSLEPAARRFATTLRYGRALLTGGGLLPVDKLKPFVSAVLPVAGELPAVTAALSAATPPLTDAFNAVGTFVNESAYSRPGHPGFLYWASWFGHNSNSVFSTGDANGSVARGLGLVSCSSLSANPALAPVITTALGGAAPCH